MPRFAILRHDGPKGLHWDLLLETGGVLRAWSLLQPPQPGATLPAEALADHRLLYLDYEGPISADRGTVTAWDRGTYDCQQQGETELILDFHGERLRGRAVLSRVPDSATAWRFQFE